MVKISIVSLIYQSGKYADWVHDSIIEYTPMIKNGDAEFFFIANDPTDRLIEHLDKKGYKYFLNINPKYSEEELFRMGYGKPEYINRVYKGWNRAILESQGEIVVLVNSDNYFSPDWLENLLKNLNKKRVVCSQLVERKHPKYGVFPGAIHGEFGNQPENFNKKGFMEFAKKIRKSGLSKGGSYMPCAFYKEQALQVGLYPEGNLAGRSFDEVIGFGDEIFFQLLKRIGVEHCTALDSISYHLKEGEMEEDIVIKKNKNDYSIKNPENIYNPTNDKIIHEKAIELYKKFADSESYVNYLIKKVEFLEEQELRSNEEIEKIVNENTEMQKNYYKLEKEFYRLLDSKAVKMSTKIKKLLSKMKLRKY